MDPTEAEDITTTILRMNNGEDVPHADRQICSFILTHSGDIFFIFPQKGSDEFLLEGDLFIPKARNAMKCLNKAFNCMWPKSSDGNVWIPYVISEKYGRWRCNGRGLSSTCSVTDRPFPPLQTRAR